MAGCVDKKVGTLLHAYELNALSENDAERFEIHLLACEHCFDEVSSFRRESVLLSSDGEIRDLAGKAAGKLERTESLPKRLWRYAWPDVPLVFKPAFVYILLFIMMIPIYKGYEKGRREREFYEGLDVPALGPSVPGKLDVSTAIKPESPGEAESRREKSEITGEDVRPPLSEEEMTGEEEMRIQMETETVEKVQRGGEGFGLTPKEPSAAKSIGRDQPSSEGAGVTPESSSAPTIEGEWVEMEPQTPVQLKADTSTPSIVAPAEVETKPKFRVESRGRLTDEESGISEKIERPDRRRRSLQPAAPISTVQSILISPDRLTDENLIRVSAGENALIQFVFRGAVPDERYRVVIESQDGDVIFQDEEYHGFDEQETGRLLLDLTEIKPGTYRIIATDPRSEPPASQQEYQFRIEE